MNELFTAELVIMKQEGYDNYIERYAGLPPEIRGDFRTILRSLQNKGIILKSCKIPEKGKPLSLFDIKFNQNFLNFFHRNAGDLGKELWETYPMFGNINGCTVSLRGITKKFNTLEDFFRAYGKEIRWNQALHKEIMDLIIWAKENTQYINTNISSFVIEHKWEELKKLKDGEIGNINYDAVKIL